MVPLADGKVHLIGVHCTNSSPLLNTPLRRLTEWTADYYLSPLAAVLRMVLPSSSALAGPRTMIEYKPTGHRPDDVERPDRHCGNCGGKTACRSSCLPATTNPPRQQ